MNTSSLSGMVHTSDLPELELLLAKWRVHTDRVVASGMADAVAWDVADLDLGSLLAQVLQPLMVMLKGGSPFALLITMAGFFLRNFLKDQSLIDLALQIITLILKPLQ